MSTTANTERPASTIWRWAFGVLPLLYLWWLLVNRLRVPWNMNPQYAYGWSVPFLCAYLIWQRVQESPGSWKLEAARGRGAAGFQLPSAFGYLLFGLFALAYAPTRLIQEANPEWSLVSWALAGQVIGLTLLAVRFALGPARLAQCAFPICFFLVAVPWPYGIENPVIQGLTRMDTALTIEALGWIGIPAMQHGNVIELATGSVGIDEACSGIRSLQATLMLSLFFGEFYRLVVARRGLCVVAGFGLALVCNLGRMLLLTWVAARRGEQAIAGWHDPAGVSILVSCFLGLWLISFAMRPKPPTLPRSGESDATVAPSPSLAGAGAGGRSLGEGSREQPNLHGAGPGVRAAGAVSNSPVIHLHLTLNPTPAPKSPPATFLKLAFTLAAWLVVVEISVAAWYHHVESGFKDSATWSLKWPETEAAFKEVPIAKKAAEMLRYDDAKQAQWLAADGTRWQLSWFYWKPGQSAGYLAKSHNPLVCMPAAGYEVSSVSPPQSAEVQGLRLPFRIYSFAQDRSTVYILYTRWDDRATEQSFATEGVSRFNRLTSVWRGRGNHGQRVASLAVWGAHGPDEARALLLDQLEKVLAVGGP